MTRLVLFVSICLLFCWSVTDVVLSLKCIYIMFIVLLECDRRRFVTGLSMSICLLFCFSETDIHTVPPAALSVTRLGRFYPL